MYINSKNNEKIREYCNTCVCKSCKQFKKIQKVLQEVKSIAKGVRGYLEVPAPRDVRFEMDRILNLITEAELPDQKESEEE